MGTLRRIRLLTMFSLLWTVWLILYWEVRQRYNVVEKEGVSAGSSDLRRLIRGQKGDIIRVGHEVQHKNIDVVGENNGDLLVHEQATTKEEQPENTMLTPQEKKEADRDKFKFDIRKRRRARERAARKESDFNSDVSRRIQELPLFHAPSSKLQHSANVESWMDNRSNALPEIKDGEVPPTRQDRLQGVYRPTRRSLVFVHLGKAAGRTIQQTFKAGCYAFQGQRRRRPCLARLRTLNETLLSQSVKTRMHCDRIGPIKDIHTATTFLWSTRDPIDRIASWFDYTNPANCIEGQAMAVNCQVDRFHHTGWVHDFFKKCFSTAESFIASLKDARIGSEVETTTGIPCNKIAWMGILGFAPPDESSHLYFNYGFYKNATISTYPDREIMAVRTEFIWDDLTSVERQLGGDTTFDSDTYGIDGTHGSQNYPHTTVLSPASQQILCCAIKDEISIYVELLTAATNLDPTTRAKSLSALAEKCNVPQLGLLSMACDATMGDAYDVIESLSTIEDAVDAEEGSTR